MAPMFSTNDDCLVDQEKFLETIKDCKWYGPFRHQHENKICIFSINEKGDNSHYVKIMINFSPQKSLEVRYFQKEDVIADAFIFKI